MGIHIFYDNFFVLKQFPERITSLSVFFGALNICYFSGFKFNSLHFSVLLPEKT